MTAGTEQQRVHRMVGGSHERPSGPECRCGAEWDWWGDCCTTAYAPVEQLPNSREGDPMIHLMSVFDEDALAIAKEADADDIPRMRDLFETFRLEDNLTVTLAHAIDEDGNEYRDLNFLVSARWKIGGETWLGGAGLKFNASLLCDQISAVLRPTSVSSGPADE